jgi:hypothetical protein
MMLVADIAPATKASAKAASASSGELFGNMGLLGKVVVGKRKTSLSSGWGKTPGYHGVSR